MVRMCAMKLLVPLTNCVSCYKKHTTVGDTAGGFVGDFMLPPLLSASTRCISLLLNAQKYILQVKTQF